MLNPRDRLTAAQALEHDYFWTDPLPADPKTSVFPSFHFMVEMLKRLQFYLDCLPMKPLMNLISAGTGIISLCPRVLHLEYIMSINRGHMEIPPLIEAVHQEVSISSSSNSILMAAAEWIDEDLDKHFLQGRQMGHIPHSVGFILLRIITFTMGYHRHLHSEHQTTTLTPTLTTTAVTIITDHLIIIIINQYQYQDQEGSRILQRLSSLV